MRQFVAGSGRRRTRARAAVVLALAVLCVGRGAARAALPWPAAALDPRVEQAAAAVERRAGAAAGGAGVWQLASARGKEDGVTYQFALGARGDWAIAGGGGTGGGRLAVSAGRELRLLPDRLEAMPSSLAGRAWGEDGPLLCLFALDAAPRSFLLEMSGSADLKVTEGVAVDGVKCTSIRGPAFQLFFDPARGAFVRLSTKSLDVRIAEWDAAGRPAAVTASAPGAAAATRTLRALAFVPGEPPLLGQARDAAAKAAFFVHPIEALPKELAAQRAVADAAPGDLSARVGLLELALRKGEVADALRLWDEVDRAAPAAADRAALLDWAARAYMPPNDKLLLDTPERRAAWVALLGRLSGVTRPYRGNANRAIDAFDRLLGDEASARALAPATDALVEAWASGSDPGTVERLLECAKAHPAMGGAVDKALARWASAPVDGAYGESPVAAQAYVAIKRWEWARASALLSSVRWGPAADESSKAVPARLLRLIEARQRVDAGGAAAAAAVADAARAYEPWPASGPGGADAIADVLAVDVALAAIRRSPDDVPAVVAAAAAAPDGAAYLGEAFRRVANDSLFSDGVRLRPELPGDRLDWAERLLRAAAAERGVAGADPGWQSRSLLALAGSRAIEKLEPRPMARLGYLDRALAAAPTDAERLPVLVAYCRTFERAREFEQGAQLMAQAGERAADPEAKRRIEGLAAALRAGQAASADWERQHQAEADRAAARGRAERLGRQLEQARAAKQPADVVAALERTKAEADAELAAADDAAAASGAASTQPTR